MILKEGDETEYVDIQDIEYIRPSQKYVDMIDFCYMVN